ncbi:unnamed protein product [Heligmosomoides polygyrus]|uniref:Integrase n=1 Tax=Heligmosomoides polygyrus TaxID=6339 RepID=A0A183GVZ9_HELPZ|nr:unnamed protein product [Heligmosomoides polygyrus]
MAARQALRLERHERRIRGAIKTPDLNRGWGELCYDKGIGNKKIILVEKLHVALEQCLRLFLKAASDERVAACPTHVPQPALVAEIADGLAIMRAERDVMVVQTAP